MLQMTRSKFTSYCLDIKFYDRTYLDSRSEGWESRQQTSRTRQLLTATSAEKENERENVRLCRISWWRGWPWASRSREQGSSVRWSRASVRLDTRRRRLASSPSSEYSAGTTANSPYCNYTHTDTSDNSKASVRRRLRPRHGGTPCMTDSPRFVARHRLRQDATNAKQQGR